MRLRQKLPRHTRDSAQGLVLVSHMLDSHTQATSQCCWNANDTVTQWHNGTYTICAVMAPERLLRRSRLHSPSQALRAPKAVRCSENSGSCSSWLFWEACSPHIVPFNPAGSSAAFQPPGADLPKQIEPTSSMTGKAGLVSTSPKPPMTLLYHLNPVSISFVTP